MTYDRLRAAALFSLAMLLACSDEQDGGVDPTPAPRDVSELDAADAPDAGEDAGRDDLDMMARDADAGEDADGGPDCPPVTPWRADRPAFVERTEESRLAAINVEAIRLSAADFDGDGDVDLIARRGANTGDDFSEGGERAVWLLANDGKGVFEDVTLKSKIAALGDDSPSGRAVEIAIWGDVDNDGDLDALTTPFAGGSATALTTVALNQGDGTFSIAPSGAQGPDQGRGAGRGGAAFVDVNLDGVLDLWLGHGQGAQGPEQDRLYLGRGDGTFEDATQALGLMTRPWTNQNLGNLNQARGHTNSWGVTACDLSNDGWPELMSASYGRAPNHLWYASEDSAGQLAYTNASLSSGYAFDERQDWRDNESARCYCSLRRNAPECTGVPEPALIRCAEESISRLRWSHDVDRELFRLGGNSGTTACADLNNDGWLDLITAEIAHWDVGSSSDHTELLYHAGEPGSPTFVRPGRAASGLTRAHDSATWDEGDITLAPFDFDNDGRLDLYIGSTDYAGTRGLLYHQQPDKTFSKVSEEVGIDHTSSHGIAVADFDNDGDLDVIVGHSRSRCASGDHCYDQRHVRYFENVIGQQQRWLQLDLVGGTSSNRAAIGARVTVEAEDGLMRTHEIGGGHGHYGIQHGLRAQIGMGASCRAEVTVRWPDTQRSVETFSLATDTRWVIRQGEQPQPYPAP